jgi:hypothetical protein
VFAPVKRHQSRSAWAVSSGPLSHRTNLGWTPRAAVILSSVVTVASASIEWATRSDRDSRVNSSTTCRMFQHLAGGGDVELVVQRPHVVRGGWRIVDRQAWRTHRGVGVCAAAAAPVDPPRATAAVPFAVHAVPSRLSTAVTPPRMGAGEVPQSRTQLPVWVDHGRGVALGRACWPTIRPARRCDSPNCCWSICTARRRRDGLTSFPG